jgi:hypothetical protein
MTTAFSFDFECFSFVGEDVFELGVVLELGELTEMVTLGDLQV